MRREDIFSENPESYDRKARENKLNVPTSVWVILGFMLWVGFFIGTLIVRAMSK